MATPEVTVQEAEEQVQAQQSPALTVYQRLMANKAILISLTQHPGWEAFLQYLMGLDEAFDIMCLNQPKTSALDKVRDALLERRLFIREILHMSNDIKTGRAFPKKQVGE